MKCIYTIWKHLFLIKYRRVPIITKPLQGVVIIGNWKQTVLLTINIYILYLFIVIVNHQREFRIVRRRRHRYLRLLCLPPVAGCRNRAN
jgi:hypothetical protein